LSDHDIAYLKWDYNREIFPSFSQGKPASDARTRALYHLLARIRAAHPHVEIESCASGGGRMDMGLLSLSDRFWPSDNTDPIDRLRIMRSASFTFALETLGSHVSSSPNHITKRTTSMDLRAKVAIFGWMGVEANPAQINGADKDLVRAAIALHKQERDLLHHGDVYRIGTMGQIEGLMVVSRDQSQAFGFAANAHGTAGEASIELAGLQGTARYQIETVDLLDMPPSPILQATGDELMSAGYRLHFSNEPQAKLLRLTKL
jgi:alpha-galactosidase